MYSLSLRPAIAMVELIFSIVVMGIVLLSIPMLVNVSTQSSYTTLQQEGISEAATHMNVIMGYAWDESDTNTSDRPPILHVAAGDPALEPVGTTHRRVGIPITSHRSFLFSDTNNSERNASATLGSDGNDTDDIDDFIGNSTLTLIDNTSEDYVEKTTVNINTAVVYDRDTVSSGGYNQTTLSYAPVFTNTGSSTNIKSITVTLTSTDTANADILAKTIVLRAFSCNIGGYNFEKREF